MNFSNRRWLCFFIFSRFLLLFSDKEDTNVKIKGVEAAYKGSDECWEAQANLGVFGTFFKIFYFFFV
jgi:hypothetical protein